MNEISLYHLHVTNASLRCLDLYGNRPERDAPIIIGVLAGSYHHYTWQKLETKKPAEIFLFCLYYRFADFHSTGFGRDHLLQEEMVP